MLARNSARLLAPRVDGQDHRMAHLIWQRSTGSDRAVLPASVPMSEALAMTIVSRHPREWLQACECYLPFLGSGLPDGAGLPG